jgi:hypothetical protein
MTDNAKSTVLNWAVGGMWMVLLPIILWLGATVQQLTVQNGIINTKLDNIEILAINRSSDRYTGSQAIARNKLVDEWRVQMTVRCNDNQDDIHENERAISFFHSRYNGLSHKDE